MDASEDKPGPLIEISDAVVLRDGRRILQVDGVRLHAGEHVAILGPNGAGKSTLIRLITREVRPLAHEDDSPVVLFGGRRRWDLFEVRKMIGVVSDELQASHRRAFTVRDVVTSGYFGSIGLYRRDEVDACMRRRTDETLELLEVTGLADRRLDTLSTGEARRALIGRALVNEPALLVLDEPCDGLDPEGAYRFRRLLSRLAAAGRTLVLVTHHVDDVIPEVERVVMLRDGRVVRDGPKESLLTSETLSDLFGFPAHVESRHGLYRLW